MNIYVDRNPNPKHIDDILSMIDNGDRPDTIEIVPRGNGMKYLIKSIDGGYTVDRYNYKANEGANNKLVGQTFVSDVNFVDELNNLLNQHGGRRTRRRKSRRTNTRKSTRRRRH